MKKFTQKKQLTAVIMAASLAFASLTGCSSSSAGKEPAGQETEAAVNVSLDDVLSKKPMERATSPTLPWTTRC